ncbi:lysine--tRNA ligase [Candidatus Woesearchaeota archaeon]|nr:lysine--tRNA ligase [Candidatus Woesearchaeota archaeon]
MDEDHRLIAEKKRKLEELRKLDIEPYPYSYDQTHHAAEIKTLFAKLQEEESSGESVSIAGRLMLFRDMGKIAFGQIQDETGRIQIMCRKNILGDSYKLFKLYDLGDFLGVKGEVIKTRTGEITVLAKEVTLLSKSVRPLPEKYHGVQDDELKFRKRYLDLLMNPEVKEMFIKRAKIIRSVRKVLDDKGFLEVETPTLQVIHGGANAKPFVTHIHAWDMPMYLSISPELYLKRLLVGGFEKVYTICKNFRNEGVDQTHNPEFTMMECYQAYVDYEEMMTVTEDCYAEASKAVNGSTKVERDGVELDFTPPWPRIKMKDAIKEHGKIDVDELSDKELKDLVKKHDLKAAEKSTRGEIIMALFEHFAEPKLIQPCHVTIHPVETTPFCKPARSGEEGMIERFESFCLGMELSNAYSEINDPAEQRKHLETQAAALKKGDEEAHPMDEDFVESVEQGMPPAGGLGVGIDRMVILLTGAEGIRDVILFPTMKPEN